MKEAEPRVQKDEPWSSRRHIYGRNSVWWNILQINLIWAFQQQDGIFIHIWDILIIIKTFRCLVWSNIYKLSFHSVFFCIVDWYIKGILALSDNSGSPNFVGWFETKIDKFPLFFLTPLTFLMFTMIWPFLAPKGAHYPIISLTDSSTISSLRLAVNLQ